MPDKHPIAAISRRDALKTGLATGTVLVGGTAIFGSTAFSGTTTAHPKPPDHEVIVGDDIDFLDGTVRTYATTNPGGNLSSIGVYMDDDALEAFDEDQLGIHLALPDEVDTHQFTFVGFHYNPEGHPPPEVYTVPHYDFHFYMLDEETIEGITTGPATYSIPEAQIPEDYQRLPVLDTDDDGEPDTPLVEEEMGEHLGDVSSPEFQPDGEFTHTNIYGAYDPDGDGTGRITFVEPMITVDFFDGLSRKTAVDLKTPDEFAQRDRYPTQYVMDPDVESGVYVSIDGFREFPGANG